MISDVYVAWTAFIILINIDPLSCNTLLQQRTVYNRSPIIYNSYLLEVGGHCTVRQCSALSSRLSKREKHLIQAKCVRILQWGPPTRQGSKKKDARARKWPNERVRANAKCRNSAVLAERCPLLHTAPFVLCLFNLALNP